MSEEVEVELLVMVVPHARTGCTLISGAGAVGVAYMLSKLMSESVSSSIEKRGGEGDEIEGGVGVSTRIYSGESGTVIG